MPMNDFKYMWKKAGYPTKGGRGAQERVGAEENIQQTLIPKQAHGQFCKAELAMNFTFFVAW